MQHNSSKIYAAKARGMRDVGVTCGVCQRRDPGENRHGEGGTARGRSNCADISIFFQSNAFI